MSTKHKFVAATIPSLLEDIQRYRGEPSDGPGRVTISSDAEFRGVALLIKSYVTGSIGEERQVCGGVITNDYLDLGQIMSNNLLLTYQEGPRREGMKQSENLELLSFAVCRIENMEKPFHSSLGYEKLSRNVNNYTLYIDVICSKSREGSNWLWGQINAIAKELGISVKLSSLSYVAAYYKRKKNFNFYTRGGRGGLVPDDTLNSMLENPEWPFFNEDAKHEAPAENDENWLENLTKRLDSETAGFQNIADNKKLGLLKEKLDALISFYSGLFLLRRETLPERLNIVNQIMELLKSQKDDAGFMLVQEFFLAAIDAGVVVGANIHVLTRRDPDAVREMLERHDIGAYGITMYSIPAIPERLNQVVVTTTRGSKRGRDEPTSSSSSKRGKIGGRKKRTRKRALRKKRRRTKHKKKRRKTHKRKRKRRRRTRKRRR